MTNTSKNYKTDGGDTQVVGGKLTLEDGAEMNVGGTSFTDMDALAAVLDRPKNVLGVQTDANLDPGASPTLGDRYLITDIAALHANFGTIEGVANYDIVEFDGTGFAVAQAFADLGFGTIFADEGTPQVLVRMASDVAVITTTAIGG